MEGWNEIQVPTWLIFLCIICEFNAEHGIVVHALVSSYDTGMMEIWVYFHFTDSQLLKCLLLYGVPILLISPVAPWKHHLLVYKSNYLIWNFSMSLTALASSQDHWLNQWAARETFVLAITVVLFLESVLVQWLCYRSQCEKAVLRISLCNELHFSFIFYIENTHFSK